MLGALLSGCASWGAIPDGARQARIEASPQFRDGLLSNVTPQRIDAVGALRSFARYHAFREPVRPVPVMARTTADFDAPPTSGLRVTWFGHSTVLVELGGVRILTDPHFSERSSPVSWTGPRRFFAPPMQIEALPRIDAVVISHDHFDHLDEGSIRRLVAAGVERFVVPLGIGAHLEMWGVPAEAITELDWWETATVGDATLHCVPSRHSSARSPNGRFRTLWSGWAMTSATRRVFYSGDTSMHEGFEEIGERLGPFDLTMIESGAYNTAWADAHLGPEQAVIAHRAVRGSLMMPVHWATFNLSVHAWIEPAERLLVATEHAGVALVIPQPGQIFEIDAPPPLRRWWPDHPWRTAREAPVVSSQSEGMWERWGDW